MKGTPIGVRILVGIVISAVLAAVVVGFFLAGSPTSRRAERLDDIRVSHLQIIHSAINSHWGIEGRLPETLEALQSPDYYTQSIRDPATDAIYEYRPLTEGRYELCANFQTDSAERQDNPRQPFSEQFWNHGVGRQCYLLEAKVADPGRIPVVPMPTPPESAP